MSLTGLADKMAIEPIKRLTRRRVQTKSIYSLMENKRL
jgi:hypothetical protein